MKYLLIAWQTIAPYPGGVIIVDSDTGFTIVDEATIIKSNDDTPDVRPILDDTPSIEGYIVDE